MQGAVLHHIRHYRAQIPATADEESSTESSLGQLSPAVLALASFADNFDKVSQQRIMSQWFVIAHHVDVGKHNETAHPTNWLSRACFQLPPRGNCGLRLRKLLGLTPGTYSSITLPT